MDQEVREVPFKEDSLGSGAGAGSRITWELKSGQVGMWAKKPQHRHKTVHISGTIVSDVFLEGSNFDDHRDPRRLHEDKTGDLIDGPGLFVLHENPAAFRPVCRTGVDVTVIALVIT
jgi:hypothetical protein